MDFIIYFFRDTIDGWLYYTLLVVNTIFILAIIGYLSEKKEEELAKYSMNTTVPTNNFSNLGTNSSISHGSMSIPVVSKTKVLNPLNGVAGNINSNEVSQPLTNMSSINNNPSMQNIPINTNNTNMAPQVPVINGNQKGIK